jgi:hypothetical protein
LRQFGSLDRVREVSEDEIAAVIGKAAARRLRTALLPELPAADSAAQEFADKSTTILE